MIRSPPRWLWLTVAALAVTYWMTTEVLGADTGGTPCLAQKGASKDGWWSWREIDGRKCWFTGPRKPKSELFWERETPPLHPRIIDVQPGDAQNRPPAVPESGNPVATVPVLPPPVLAQEPPNPKLTEDDLLAYTCCWPDMAELEAQQIGLRKFDLAPMPEPLRPASNFQSWTFVMFAIGVVAMLIALFMRVVIVLTPRSRP